MKNSSRNLLLSTLAIAMVGCSNIGNAPAGASADQMQASFNQLPVEERAKMLLALPGTKEGKEQKIKDMYAKAGKTPPADISSLAGTPSTPGGAK